MVARRYHLLTRMSSCKSPRVKVDEAVKQFSLPRGNLTLFEKVGKMEGIAFYLLLNLDQYILGSTTNLNMQKC